MSVGETSLRKKNIFVFGSSLTSTYWNGAATYYRGIYKYLHRLGYRIIFAEPAIYSRQDHRDSSNIDYAEVRVYQSPNDIPKLINEAAHAQIVIKHSGVGIVKLQEGGIEEVGFTAIGARGVDSGGFGERGDAV